MFRAMCLHENSDVEKLLMLSTIKSFYLSKTFRMSFLSLLFPTDDANIRLIFKDEHS